MALSAAQKAKTKFRSSSKWRKFRHEIHVKQKGIDPITKKKLLKRANLHHLDLDEDHYQDLTNEDNFVFLNEQTHEVLHILWRYYVKDRDILDRYKYYLDKMLEVNKIVDFKPLNKEEV